MTARDIFRHRNIAQHAAVAQAHHTLAMGGNFVFVGHDDDRLSFGMNLPKKREDLDRRRTVEISSRLVGEKDRRSIEDGARDRNTLTLTSRELVRTVMHPVCKSDTVQRSKRALSTTTPSALRVYERQLDILKRGLPRKKFKALKDEANLLVADLREFLRAHSADIATIEEIHT
jgi:hypothetical protein